MTCICKFSSLLLAVIVVLFYKNVSCLTVNLDPKNEFKVEFLNNVQTRSAEPRFLNWNFSDPLNDLVLKIIHELQQHMHDGIPALGIPPLDPFSIDKYDFNIKETSLKAKGELKNILVKNLSSFNVTNISTHLFKRNINVTIEVPDLLIDGQYDLKGSIFSFLPLSGDGGFVLKPKDAICTTFAVLGYGDGHFHLKAFDYKVKIKDLYAKFDGIYGGGIINKVLNSILNKFGLTLFDHLEIMVHEDVRKMLQDGIDKLLKEIKVGDMAEKASFLVSGFSSAFWA